MPGRRANYSLLSQFPDDQQPHQSKFYESLSLEKNKGRNDRPFDWPVDSASAAADHRRIGSIFSTSGLQRQSSGSSFGESSLSGEYYLPTLSAAGNDPDLVFNPLLPHEDGFKAVDPRLRAADATGSSSSKTWAESYQLQLALALRLSSEATCADDPNLFCPASDNCVTGYPPPSAESVSHRFWVWSFLWVSWKLYLCLFNSISVYCLCFLCIDLYGFLLADLGWSLSTIKSI